MTFYFLLALLLGVAPYTGAWIEINGVKYQVTENIVAPYTGAWIEIQFKVLN